MITAILVMIVVGAIAGLLARAIVPGSDPLGAVGTVILGIVGAVVGGFLFRLLFDSNVSATDFSLWNVIGATVGAVIALLIYRAVVGRNTHARL